MIHRRGPWRSFEAVEYATLEWVDRFNHRRLFESIGNIPPAKAEERSMLPRTSSIWPRDSHPTASGKPGAVHCHYESHDQLQTHLADFMAADNFAQRLKTLSDLTPYKYIAKIWTSQPRRFIVNPIHQMPRRNA